MPCEGVFKFPSYVLTVFGYISYVFSVSCYCNVFLGCIFRSSSVGKKHVTFAGYAGEFFPRFSAFYHCCS